MPVKIEGNINGGLASGSPVHSDFPGEMMKLPQANGGVKTKVTSHMTGNNEEGPIGGIDNKGTGTHGSRF